jgi:large conductance mechanosensitive channel
VQDIVMPPIGFVMGGVDFSNLFLMLEPGTKVSPPYESLAAAKAAGAVTLNYGFFINTLIQFLIVAFVTFMLVRSVNKLRRASEPADVPGRECPFCRQPVHDAATRCPACTSELQATS